MMNNIVETYLMFKANTVCEYINILAEDMRKVSKIPRQLNKLIYKYYDLHLLSSKPIDYETLKKKTGLNEENERLSRTYGGSYGFVKTLSDCVVETDIDRSVLEKVLAIIYNNIKDIIYDDALIVQGKKGFVDTTKTKVTIELVKAKLFTAIKSSYDDILENLYINLLLYRDDN